MSTKNLKIKKVSIVGVIPSFAFQRAKQWAIELHRSIPQRYPFPEIRGMLELDWNEKLLEWRRKFGKDYWCLRRPVAVFFNDQFVGTDVDLMKLTSFGNVLYENIPRRNTADMQKILKEEYHAFLKKTKRIYCYLDITVDEVYIGTLTFRLYSDLLPGTCENFKKACMGTEGHRSSYKDSKIHRIVKEGWLQCGEGVKRMKGGDQCYGISHDRTGVLSMANNGKFRTGAQFFVTLRRQTWMDRYYVAFGQMVEGVKVLRILENLETFYESPLQDVRIKNCGKLDLEDVDDVDAAVKVAEMPKEPARRVELETIAEEMMRVLLNALTNALEMKQHIHDVLDERDIPSKLNLQMYFQGLYSVPEEVLEDSAVFIRKLRRELNRYLKPNAMEVVEAILYDLLVAVLAKITNLDDIRETLGRPLYNKLLKGIDMEIEMVKKDYVKKFVDQLVNTAENIVTIVSKKLEKVKTRPQEQLIFESKMSTWVKSFVLQESYADDNYRFMELSSFSKDDSKWKQPCPVFLLTRATPDNIFDPKVIKKRLEQEEKERRKSLVCTEEKDAEVSPIMTQDVFSACRYNIFAQDEPYRLPIRDFFETGRYKLRMMRNQEKRKKPKYVKCLERKIKRYMKEVQYIPETTWIKETISTKEEGWSNHLDELMYGAMTVGLLEIYFLMEQHIKAKLRRMMESRKYPDEIEPSEASDAVMEEEEIVLLPADAEVSEKPDEKEPVQDRQAEQPKSLEVKEYPILADNSPDEEYFGEFSAFRQSVAGEIGSSVELNIPEFNVPEKTQSEIEMEDIDIEAILAEVTSLQPEEVNIASFKWMKSYILEKGNDAKSNFAAQVHKWLEGEMFCYTGLLSKHSLATRASLLSLSLSLASLIKESNTLKTEMKSFVYDLWELYFNEMFKETLIQYPQPQASYTSLTDKKAGTPHFAAEYAGEAFIPSTFDESRPLKGPMGSEVGEDDLEIAVHTYSGEGPAGIIGTVRGTRKGKEKLKTVLEDVEEEDEVFSSEEERNMPPYKLPFWIRFLTAVTKQALGKISKLSRLPRRLYFTTDSQMAFDDKMKAWFEFNRFNPPHIKGKEILDYIHLHHKDLTDLDTTARSFMKKKTYSQLVDKCTRQKSAQQLANDLLLEVLSSVMGKVEHELEHEEESAETLVGDLMAAVIKTDVEKSKEPTVTIEALLEEQPDAGG